MKSKRAVFILLLLVIIIWGLIAYRIYSTIKSDEISPIKNDFVNNFESVSPNEDFKLVANYRDPFLGKLMDVNVTRSKAKVPVAIIPLQWPEIKYKGIIKNQQSSKLLVMVSINGKEKIMKADQTIDQVTLSKIYRDSIIVIFKNEKRTLGK